MAALEVFPNLSRPTGTELENTTGNQEIWHN
jgi:hypothetical protein